MYIDGDNDEASDADGDKSRLLNAVDFFFEGEELGDDRGDVRIRLRTKHG